MLFRSIVDSAKVSEEMKAYKKIPVINEFRLSLIHILWNNDWVDEPYKGAFPQYKICTEWVRDSYTPVIDIDEIRDVYKRQFHRSLPARMEVSSCQR